MVYINQSKKAKNRILKLAKCNTLAYEIVFPLISLFWDYDGEGGWADYKGREDEFNLLANQVKSQLSIHDTYPAKDVCIEQLLCELNVINANREKAYNKFLFAVNVGSSCLISEFATLHYLRNANRTRLSSMDWGSKSYTDKGILWALFLKLFRAGCVDRDNLDYVYADLLLPLPYQFDFSSVEDRVMPFIKEVNASSNLTLSGLKKLLLSYAPNAKDKEQVILEALAYAEILQVKGHPVKDIFLFDKRMELSGHYHSNEYHYPLRFWNGR